MVYGNFTTKWQGVQWLEVKDLSPPLELFIGDIYALESVDSPISHPGALVHYTITASNIITNTIENVVITDTLPISLTYEEISLIASSGTAGYHDGVITWTGPITASTTVTESVLGRLFLRLSRFGISITNEAVINAEGNAYSRQATIDIVPYKVYMPCTSRACLPTFKDDFSNPCQRLVN